MPKRGEAPSSKRSDPRARPAVICRRSGRPPRCARQSTRGPQEGRGCFFCRAFDEQTERVA
eukprot:4959693-Lingulodinium_polyedra.AAC.1